ncbi:hypothetical protein Z950_4219 [Sulfitobacter mediterraneus KCTC 32188]|nr:hypothetical protein Z950_4219 [Sulfitobacter mediterraneus KCTC 32188]
MDERFDFERYGSSSHLSFLCARFDNESIDLVFAGKRLKGGLE